MSVTVCEASISSKAVITSSIAIAVIAALFYNVLPLVLGVAQDSRQLSDIEIGWIGSVFFVGYNLMILSSFFWIRKVNWRTLSYLSLTCSSIGFILPSLSSNFNILLLGVFIAGCSSSIIYGLATTIIGDSDRPTRWFGIKIALEGGLGAALFFILPVFIVPAYGFNGLMISLAVITICFFPFLFYLPVSSSKGLVEVNEINSKQEYQLTMKELVAVIAMIVATGLFFTGESAAWSFMDRIANEVGIEASMIGIALGIILLFATLGSFAAAIWGERFHFIWGILLVTVLFFVAILLLNQSEVFVYYLIGGCILSFSFGWGITLYVAFTSKLDLNGNFVIMTVPAIGIGAMLGPGLAGWLSFNYGTIGLLVVSSILIFIAFLLTWTATQLQT